jgi:hypothetical protein
LPEPDFCIETLPPVIDKTVKGVLLILAGAAPEPQAVIPKNKDIMMGTGNKNLSRKLLKRMVFSLY